MTRKASTDLLPGFRASAFHAELEPEDNLDLTALRAVVDEAWAAEAIEPVNKTRVADYSVGPRFAPRSKPVGVLMARALQGIVDAVDFALAERVGPNHASLERGGISSGSVRAGNPFSLDEESRAWLERHSKGWDAWLARPVDIAPSFDLPVHPVIAEWVREQLALQAASEEAAACGAIDLSSGDDTISHAPSPAPTGFASDTCFYCGTPWEASEYCGWTCATCGSV